MEVEMIEVLSRDQPGSVKIAGRGGLFPLLELLSVANPGQIEDLEGNHELVLFFILFVVAFLTVGSLVASER